jgi:hypothetical protein
MQMHNQFLDFEQLQAWSRRNNVQLDYFFATTPANKLWDNGLPKSAISSLTQNPKVTQVAMQLSLKLFPSEQTHQLP